MVITMQEILYINACVRKESRTERLAQYLLRKLQKPYQEVKLESLSFPKVDEAFLQKRDSLIQQNSFDDPSFALAREFSKARIIVIAAPFWDLSFPAALKQYFELINVLGVTFTYSEDGIPVGLCNAEKLYYITTAGGFIPCDEYGFGYIKVLAQSFYQIPQVKLIKAEGLDIVGADVGSILRKAEKTIDNLL